MSNTERRIKKTRLRINETNKTHPINLGVYVPYKYSLGKMRARLLRTKKI